LGGKELSAIFLSFLMVLTPLANAYVFGNFMQQPKVFTQSFVKTVEVDGRKFELQGLGKVTQYLNGTQVVEGSVTIENLSEHILRLRVNLTKVVTPEELSLWRGEIKINEKSSIYSKDSFASNTITFTKEIWDNLLFVVDSPQIWIKYKHDDNYETYHPGNFNEPWEFKPHDVYEGEQLYNEKFHTHMSINDVYDWYTGAKSEEEIMAKYVKGTQLGINIIGIALAASITFKLGSSILGILLDAVVTALVLLFNWLLEVLGISNKSQWIQNVVMAEQGDGFFWSWGFHTKGVADAKIYDPGIPYIGPGLEWYIIQEYSQWFSQYHRIGAWVQPIREFYRTWGSQRDASPEIWTVEPMIELGYIPAGIFADYGSLSK
jgi:hypothetical protein